MLISHPTVLLLPHGIDRYTKLMLFCDGTNGSNIFTDESNANHTVTPIGTAQVTTAQQKFGTGSLSLPASGDHLEIPTSTDWQFGNGPFTIEAWVRPTASHVGTIFDVRGQVAPSLANVSWILATNTLSGGRFEFYASSNGTSFDVANALVCGTMTLNAWQHIRVTRHGNSFYVYKNGVLQNSITSSASLFASTSPLRIGAAQGGVATFQGQLDMPRVCKGIARSRGGAFTPPTRAYHR
jgi:hypothetical protein